MAVLGKRKASEASVSQQDADDIFKRYFESQFAPLEPSKRPASDDDDNDNDDHNEEVAGFTGSSHVSLEGEDESSEAEEDEWAGLSGNEDGEQDTDEAPRIQVVDHSVSQASKTASMSKRELKIFMSSKINDQSSPSTPQPQQSSKRPSSSTLPEDAPSLLAQDLELRRLLSESHLLNPTRFSHSVHAAQPPAEAKAFASGRTRAKATDLRVQALGSKASIHTQEKMPMSMRKGIVKAQEGREAKRRREAKENGVVLERETGKGKNTRRRGRSDAVDRPGVGRMRGAELKISERDVKRIEGVRDVFGRKGNKRR